MADRVTQAVLEGVHMGTPHARVTQTVIELVLSSNAVLGPGNGDSSLLWLPSLEQQTHSHAGARNLLIQLNVGQSVPNDGLWKECRVISSLAPCSFPNYISFGGYYKWDFDTALPVGVQILQRIGLRFYDVNEAFLSEFNLDFGGGAVQGTGGLWIRMVPSLATVPSGAAYFAMQLGAFVNNNPSTGGPFLTSTHKYADLRWDDVFMIQQTDPSNAIQPKGSLPPNWSTPFTYASTSSSITWAWAGTAIFRADGTTQPIPAGSVAVAGLTASTTYYFFPYWDENLQVLAWVVGTHGTTPNNFAFLSAELDLTQSQQQNLLSRVALSTTAMQAATVAVGGGGGGGYGGGSGRCNRVGTKVTTRTRGVQKLEDCFVGEEIKGRKGWTVIMSLQVMPSLHFIRLELENGNAIEVTPTHPFTIPSDQGDIERRAMEFALQDMLYTTTGVAYPKSISVVKLSNQKHLTPGDRAACVTVSCLPECEFYAGENEPTILSHNMQAQT